MTNWDFPSNFIAKVSKLREDQIAITLILIFIIIILITKIRIQIYPILTNLNGECKSSTSNNW